MYIYILIYFARISLCIFSPLSIVNMTAASRQDLMSVLG